MVSKYPFFMCSVLISGEKSPSPTCQ
jgi:hypothetical protein